MNIGIVFPSELSAREVEDVLEYFLPLLPMAKHIAMAGNGNVPAGLGRVSMQAMLNEEKFDLVLMVDPENTDFKADITIRGKLVLKTGLKVPAVPEAEAVLLNLKHSHLPKIREIANFLLDKWCNKTPVIVYWRDFKGSAIEKQDITDMVTSRFEHRGEIINIETESQLKNVIDLKEYSLWVFVSNRYEYNIAIPEGMNTDIEIHVISPEGYFSPFKYQNGKLMPYIGGQANPQTAEHVFAALPDKNVHASWFLFPYGYGLNHSNGGGPIDSFGYRANYMPGDFIDKRPEDHKVIAVFGGSGAHGVEVYHTRTMSYVLEELLNKDSNIKITVMNLSLSGQMLLNQVTTYILMCHKLKPDMVISHDGYNDLVTGMINDPFLLSKYQIAYPLNFEQWARMLHAKPEARLNQDFSLDSPMVALNSPHNVIAAYLERKIQFANLVMGQSQAFVWGLQPAHFCKKLSINEEVTINKFMEGQKHYRPIYDRLPLMYDLLANKTQLPEGAIFADVHDYFSRFGENDDLFCDIVHLSLAGHARAAEFYAKVIKESAIWQKWQEEK